MGQVLHGSATTTEAVRRAIQLREESVRSLAKRYGASPTTVQKWRKRTSTADARMGPKEPRSTVLTVEEEAIVVAFRRHTLLPLDDCLYDLQPTIPHLTRSSLHRCLERHGISRLPEIDGDKPKKQRFATYAIGYVHLDLAEVSTAEGKLRLFVAIDRTSKFAFVRLVESAGKMEAAQFLRDFIEAVPYRIHTMLTDNGVQFTLRRQDIYDSQHIFDRVCDEHGIEHRLTKPRCSWTTDEVEQSPCCDPCYFVAARGRPRDEEPGSRCKPGRAVFRVAPPLRRPWVRTAHAGSSPRSGVGRHTHYPTPFRSSTGCPACPSGWVTVAIPATASATTSGRPAHSLRYRPSGTRHRSPVQTNFTTTATSSSDYGRASRSGAPSLHATRRLRSASPASSPSLPPSTGSSDDRV